MICEFNSKYSCFYFKEGIITFGCYSYITDSWVANTLSEQQCKQLYEKMKEYFEENNNGK